MSFLIVGIIWLNHHATVQLLARTDHGVQVLNLLLLLPVSVLPWPTAVLAEYARHGTARDHRVAVLLYGGTSTAMVVAFTCSGATCCGTPSCTARACRPELLRVRSRRYDVGLLVPVGSDPVGEPTLKHLKCAPKTDLAAAGRRACGLLKPWASSPPRS